MVFPISSTLYLRYKVEGGLDLYGVNLEEREWKELCVAIFMYQTLPHPYYHVGSVDLRSSNVPPTIRDILERTFEVQI